MTLIPYINPLAQESQKIVSTKSNLDNLEKTNNDLIDIINHIPSQNIDGNIVPKSLKDLALKRIKWYIERTNNKKFEQRDFLYLFNPEIMEYDVICFHMLAQAIAIKFNTTSRETKLFIDSQKQIILDRINRLSDSERPDIINTMLDQLEISTGVNWTTLKDIIGTRKLSLTELLLNEGELVLDEAEFEYLYQDKLDRRPEVMYNLLVGDKLKEEIISLIIMQNSQKYIENIKEKSSIITIHKNIENLGNDLEKLINEEMSKYSSFYANAGSYEIGKLIREAFPPCISETVSGVSSGGRNDAIVLLLTSFVSYARLYPGIFGSDGTVKVSDIDKNLKITENEILPLIFEAADNCTPPLFEDQPQEKINIISKLGFGMHETINLENEGETKWYTPMSCDKIKMHLPNLCHPDKDCKKINNPLSCYGIKRNRAIREGKTEKKE